MTWVVGVLCLVRSPVDPPSSCQEPTVPNRGWLEGLGGQRTMHSPHGPPEFFSHP